MFAEAIAACDRDLKAMPSSPALYTLKGLALQGAGGPAMGLAALRKALALQANYEPALLAAAQTEFALRDPGAVSRLQAVLRLRPASAEAHVMLATMHFEARRCDEALPHFRQAGPKQQPPSTRWQYAVCLLDLQQWPDAAREFSALLELREHAPSRFNLGLAYWHNREYPAAVAALQPLDPTADADAMRLLASALELSGNVPQALTVLQNTLARHPDDQKLLVDLAIMCMDHNALELGLEVVKAGKSKSPASPQLQTLEGILLVRKGEVAKGQEALAKVDSSLGRIGLASAMMQMGLAAEAEKVLREELQKSGGDPKVELTLARAMLLQSLPAERARAAAVLLTGVVKREPRNAAAHGLLGKVYGLLREDARAVSALTEAIRLDPADRASTYQLMTIYKRLGRNPEADQLTQRVKRLLEEEKRTESAGSKFQLIRQN